MDSTFRMGLRKPEGISKKGPLVAKHSLVVSCSVGTGAISPTTTTPNGPSYQSKEIKSPIRSGPPPVLQRRRQISPDPRDPTKKEGTRRSPKSSPVRNTYRNRSNSPSNRQRIGPTPMRAIGNPPPPSRSPPTKRISPPTSPRFRRPISPIKKAPPSPNLNNRITDSNWQCNSKTSTAAPFLNDNVRPPSPAGSCKRQHHPPSPSNSRPASPRGRGSSPGSKPPPISEEALNARIGKALKARLYLLHQPGPNSFSVGGDSPSHKYRVIIGPQTCSCSHGPYCIHVLFVMVRVLQVSESNPLLMAGSLKDYEVEQLLRNWEERRKKAIRARERRTSMGVGGPREKVLRNGGSKGSKTPPSSPTSVTPGRTDSSPGNFSDEDGQCPICLMTMVEGESLVACEAGCRNSLHHHCMAVWAADRHAQGQPLLCPLCRAPWVTKWPPRMGSRIHQSSQGYQSQRSLISRQYASPYSFMSASFSGSECNIIGRKAVHSPASTMSRSLSSACPTRLDSRHGHVQADSAYSSPSISRSPIYCYPPTVRGEISVVMATTETEDLVPLPRSEPIPPEHEDAAAAWIYVFGRELIACLFSRDWAVRETGLRRLAHEVVKVLHWDSLVTSDQMKQKVIHCCFHILAQVANDPVYKVYIACLRCLRVLLSLLCPSESDEVSAVQELLKPLLYTILLKCADGNRRTSQISIDSMVELCRGQTGELALGTQSCGVQDGPGLGGIDFVLSYILEESLQSQLPWQWLLGRLCVLDRLLDEFPEEFQLQTVEINNTESGYKLEHYDRLMTVVEFAFKALGSNHATVVKLARRIYICGARMTIVEPAVFRQVCDMLSKLDVSLQMRLKRRLKLLQEGVGHGERKCSFARLGEKFSSALSSKKDDTRLCRSMSYSPSRMLSIWRSSSRSPARPAPTTSSATPPVASKALPPQDNTASVKPIRRPNHLPLDSIDAKFKEKQSKLRHYHKSKSKYDVPLIVQQALIPNPPLPPFPSKKKGKKYSKQSVQSIDKNTSNDIFYYDDIDLSPRSLGENDLPKYSLKNAISSPITPLAPSTTPVREYLEKCKLRCCSNDESFPHIPGLHLIPRYLDKSASSEEMIIEDEHYLEGRNWIKGPLLGTGAFSSCYQARDIETGTLMAVKQLSICRNSEEEQERVETTVEEEILMMSKLNHVNIMKLLGATRIGSSFSVFSEWMAGGSVASMLERYGPFSERVIIRYSYQILAGLSYLHDNMILHRDLKGANLLVDSTGQELRIGDFGTAVKLASKRTITGEFQGQLLGTIAFMAPEVLRGDDYGRACDLWSVGCCIIEMATTKPPWGADHVSNQYKLMFRIATSSEPPTVPDSLSDGARDVAHKCLQLNSEERPTSKQLLQHSLFDNLPP